VPGLGDPPGLWGRGAGRAAGRCAGLGGVRGGEQVVGAGEELAGDRSGGDLLPAPAGDRGAGGAEFRGAFGGLSCLVEDPAQPGRALFGDVPVADGQIRSADCWGQPGPAGQLAGRRERVMSPISASITSAVNWPTPGSAVKTLTRGSALACWRSSPSIRSTAGARASMNARQSVTISRDTAGRPSSASHPRPGPLQ
jgi:hypothetical protein